MMTYHDKVDVIYSCVNHVLFPLLAAGWPKTASGLPSTAGTTATVCFLRDSKLYIGHVGDSGVVLGKKDPEREDWMTQRLTRVSS